MIIKANSYRLNYYITAVTYLLELKIKLNQVFGHCVRFNRITTPVGMYQLELRQCNAEFSQKNALPVTSRVKALNSDYLEMAK